MLKLITISFLLASTSIPTTLHAGTEGMKDLPQIKSGQIHTVDGSEDFESEKGFGDQEPMVKMMNLMMVEGSGYEGMTMGKDASMKKNPPSSGHSMASMNESKKDQNYKVDILNDAGSAKVGANKIKFKVIRGAQAVKKLKLNGRVFMLSMDMGESSPKINEITPGIYEIKSNFTMRGEWAIEVSSDQFKEQLKFDAR